MQVERISADITLKHKPKTGTQAYNMLKMCIRDRSIVEPTEKKTPQKTTEKVDSETKMGQEESAAGQQENQQPTEKQLQDVYKRQVQGLIIKLQPA